MIRAFRLYQGLKEIDSIWVILKEPKSRGEKKVERKLDASRKRYVRAANTNTLVQTHDHALDYDHAPDLRSSSWRYRYTVVH